MNIFPSNFSISYIWPDSCRGFDKLNEGQIGKLICLDEGV